MTARSIRVSLLGTTLIALVVAGCGGDSGSDTVGTGQEIAASAPSPTDPSTVEPTMTPTTVTPTTVTPTTVTPTTAPATPTSTTAPAVFDFAADPSTEGWSVVNDTVMGGVSSGQLDSIDGMLVFTGELSLDNNGGFASVRSPLIDPQQAADWADRDGPRIQVEGDGRTWTVEVRTADFDGGWIAELATSADGLTDVTLPWLSFEPVTRFLDPRETDAPLDPAAVVSIAFYLVDGIEAPFRLGIRSIA